MLQFYATMLHRDVTPQHNVPFRRRATTFLLPQSLEATTGYEVTLQCSTTSPHWKVELSWTSSQIFLTDHKTATQYSMSIFFFCLPLSLSLTMEHSRPLGVFGLQPNGLIESER